MANQTLKGFRDFLPGQMAVRNRVKKILIDVFESCGFEPLATPDLEYAEVLLGKYGSEADKLVYTFEDRGERLVGMPYDLTVPTARVAANYSQELPLPFKRYQIQRVHRAENTQKGRYREFEQCDVDILNTNSPVADAELISMMFRALSRLNIPEFTIMINSRPLLYAIFAQAGIAEDKFNSAAISIDKLDKMSQEEVKSEMIDRGVSSENIDKLFEIFTELESQYSSGQAFVESTEFTVPGITEELSQLQEIAKLAVRMGVEPNQIVPTFSLARGLDYYTGIIYEAVSQKFSGSLCAGGRYDKLIQTLGGPDWPAVGVSFGLDRICDVLEESQIWQDVPSTPTQILITVFSPELMDESIKVTKLLRDSGVNAEVYLDSDAKLDKQLKFADKKQIPWVAILGPEELKEEKLILKNLKAGTQETMLILDLPHKIR